MGAWSYGQCEIPFAHVSYAILGYANCPFYPLHHPGYGGKIGRYGNIPLPYARYAMLGFC